MHSEFGRMPISQRGVGRDHNPGTQTVLMAGAGIKGGQVIGASDEFGYKAMEQPISYHDLHATMLHLLGLDHTRLTYRFNGRDMRLTDVYGTLIPQIAGTSGLTLADAANAHIHAALFSTFGALPMDHASRRGTEKQSSQSHLRRRGCVLTSASGVTAIRVRRAARKRPRAGRSDPRTRDAWLLCVSFSRIAESFRRRRASAAHSPN